MINIYDLFLNFQINYYEFYEWNNTDNLMHIKKINLMKISSDDYNNILNKEISFNDDFLFSIFNKCEYIENRKVLTIPYAILFTDSYRVVGVVIDINGHIIKYSSLDLEDEEDVLDVSEKLACCKIKYKILGEKCFCYDKTRDEIEIINYIRNDLKDSFRLKKYDKIKYLYYEYFGIESNNLDKIRDDFDIELSKNISDKHYNLYNIIKLSKLTKRV